MIMIIEGLSLDTIELRKRFNNYMKIGFIYYAFGLILKASHHEWCILHCQFECNVMLSVSQL